MKNPHEWLDAPIEFLKGVGPQRATLLQKELGIFTKRDLLFYYPFRYEDRSKIYSIRDVHESLPFIQLKGKITKTELQGDGRKRRLVAYFTDGTGTVQLVWFQGIPWVMKKISPNTTYFIFGKPALFNNSISFSHPDIQPEEQATERSAFLPVYSSTETLKKRFMDNKVMIQLIKNLLEQLPSVDMEVLPEYLRTQEKLIAKNIALQKIHFPQNGDELSAAQQRLKFDELFFLQWRLLKLRSERKEKNQAVVFSNTKLVTEFYHHHLPFALTNAQKSVIKEIYADLKSGKQMNRLLQGDVGSGKTVVAFITMLMVAASGYQSALMAPTEILAHQHFEKLKLWADALGLTTALLTGSTKSSEKKKIIEQTQRGELSLLIGTHALLEEDVQFKNAGLILIDEQHRFGVAQRAQMWEKNQTVSPHILVMTATPIPRTLAMTLYGDLDVSIINELPAGRKPIVTTHRYDSHRLQVFAFLQKQLDEGRQVYVVYPLIEESEKLDLKHVMDGYEAITRAFPLTPVSILHGKMKADAKEFEMKRFVKGETRIMVSTTVIEVGVDVPNASVMVIENAERFGLSQLHQLRGRVGRGAAQSYCILMSDVKLSKMARERIDIFCKTNNGFEIAEHDLRLRGPGDIVGTQQSGTLNLRLAELSKDAPLLHQAREAVLHLLTNDPTLSKPENAILKNALDENQAQTNWSKIG